ncbi:hypothetical protein F7725_026960 [Dissostichus mawsoni]|uniref:DUF4371 domain-containing protein n=1 Tax=Dissostichus mawsoni TaxID=36200 RepID=A0A7J5X8J3_DISMA|nr:hypothetical protein F7725_026960 [Dissostichus mawsoni]
MSTNCHDGHDPPDRIVQRNVAQLRDGILCVLSTFRGRVRRRRIRLHYKLHIRFSFSQIKNNAEHYAVIVDETRDCSGHEQLSLTVRWVSDDYVVHEDFIGMYDCPKTDALSITLTIKDMLLRCGLDIGDMRGQTYDGASVLQGQMSGVAKRFKDINPKAISMHCTNHSLNLILQEAASKCNMVRGAFSLVHDIHEVINNSPKRLAIFNTIRDAAAAASPTVSGLTPLCPTRWTARGSAIKSLLANYEAVYDTLDEIIRMGGNTEASKKAPGLQALMTQFSVFFGLKVCLTLFSSAEEVARVLQSKDLSAETVKSAVQMLQTHYTNLRSTEAFHSIFEEAQRTNMSDLVQAPALPPRRRAPRRYDDGDASHQWENPEDYFRSQFFSILVNGPPGFGSINIPQNLVDMYTGDIDMERLSTQLSLFPAVLQAHNSSSAAERPTMQVTKVSTITDMQRHRDEARNPSSVKWINFYGCI